MSNIVGHQLRSLGKYLVWKASCRCSNVSFWSSTKLSNQAAAWFLNNNGVCWLSEPGSYILSSSQDMLTTVTSRASLLVVLLKNDGFIKEADAEETAAIIKAAAAISGWGWMDPSLLSPSMDSDSSNTVDLCGLDFRVGGYGKHVDKSTSRVRHVCRAAEKVWCAIVILMWVIVQEKIKLLTWVAACWTSYRVLRLVFSLSFSFMFWISKRPVSPPPII